MYEKAVPEVEDKFVPFTTEALRRLTSGLVSALLIAMSPCLGQTTDSNIGAQHKRRPSTNPLHGLGNSFSNFADAQANELSVGTASIGKTPLVIPLQKAEDFNWKTREELLSKRAAAVGRFPQLVKGS